MKRTKSPLDDPRSCQCQSSQVEQCSPAAGHLSVLKAEVNEWFTRGSLDALLCGGRSLTERVASGWLAKGGHRWRPLLACSVYRCCCTGEHCNVELIKRLAVAVECLHKASLVHDDIEDGDAVRYNEPTLHKEYGIPMALNMGDLLLAEGYRLMATAELAAERKVRLLEATADVHRDLCVGQGLELEWAREPHPLSADDVLSLFARKTAPAFGLALCTGAVAAGAGLRTENILREFGRALGIAYQVLDDIRDHASVVQGKGKSHDLRPSVHLGMACERDSEEVGKRLEASFGRCEAGGSDEPAADELYSVLAEPEVADAVDAILTAQRDHAMMLAAAVENRDLQWLLKEVIAQVLD